MEKKRTAGFPGVGLASLLVIFAVLCLSVFALLSISTVRSDERLGDATQQAVQGYYGADCRAQEILAQLRAGRIPPEVTEENGVFSYQCPISDTQVLEVQVKLQGDQYYILRWQAVSAVSWQPENTLPVWNGQ